MPKAKVPEPLESEIQRQILEYLSLIGVFCWRQNSGAMRTGKRYVRFTSIEGVADIIGIWQGRFLAIEVKRRSTSPTESQVAFLDAVNRAGGLGFVARSVDDVIRAFELKTEREKTT